MKDSGSHGQTREDFPELMKSHVLIGTNILEFQNFEHRFKASMKVLIFNSFMTSSKQSVK